jgi:outer membrane protein TolC
MMCLLKKSPVHPGEKPGTKFKRVCSGTTPKSFLVMKKILTVTILFLSFWGSLYGQELTLFDCLEKAEKQYPLLRGKEVLLKSADLNIRNLRTNWLPQMDVFAQALWQSDVSSIDSDTPMPGLSVPQAPKDQYKIALDVSQTLYDGGRTRKGVEVEKISGEVAVQDIEVQMLEVSKRVTDLFYSILMLEEQKHQVNHKLKVINSRRDEFEVLLENGAVSERAVKKMDAECFSVQQQLITIRTNQEALLANLSSFLGRRVEVASDLEKPSAGDLIVAEQRPEYYLFALKRNRLEKMTALQQRNRWPVLAAFGQGGYGNPGYNMLKDEFDTFFMVGLKLKWTPWDWKETKRKKQVFENQIRMIDLQEETFRVNQSRSVSQLAGEISRYQHLLELDSKIVELRRDIEEDSADNLKNGTITTADYLGDLDAHIGALINKELHQLAYLRGMTMKYLTGQNR